MTVSIRGCPFISSYTFSKRKFLMFFDRFREVVLKFLALSDTDSWGLFDFLKNEKGYISY